MNKFQILSLFCFILGIIFFSLGFLQGDVEGGIFIVFPFIGGSGIYAFFGVISLFLAILFFSFGFTSSLGREDLQYEYEEHPPQKKTSIKGGGVILIGPIPIVFGSNWKIALVMMIVAIILILVVFFAFRTFLF
jgi:uncharacterized protein (TIGR00304 family)